LYFSHLPFSSVFFSYHNLKILVLSCLEKEIATRVAVTWASMIMGPGSVFLACFCTYATPLEPMTLISGCFSISCLSDWLAFSKTSHARDFQIINLNPNPIYLNTIVSYFTKISVTFISISQTIIKYCHFIYSRLIINHIFHAKQVIHSAEL